MPGPANGGARIWTLEAYDAAHTLSRRDSSLEFGFTVKLVPTDARETERKLAHLVECVALVSAEPDPQ